MSTKSTSSDIFGAGSGEVRSVKMRQFFNKMLFHWPLYLICFILSMGGALFYLRYTRPIYEVHAKVLIKDDRVGNKKPALEELNLVDIGKNVDAEASLMGSFPITEQVVTDLQLWVYYKQPTGYFSYRDLYRNSPVQFKLLKPGRSFLNDYLDIVIKSENEFLLKQSNKKTKRFSFKNNFVNSFGTWRLDTTSHLRENIGKTIRIYLFNPKDMTKYYIDNISESVLPKSLNVDLQVDDEVPERGRDILNDVMRVYMDVSVQQKRSSSQNILKFVDQRLTSITQELNNVESKAEGYKSNRGITEIADQSTLVLNSAQITEKQLNDINIKLSVLDGIEHYVDSNQGADNPPATLGMDDSGLISLVKQLTDLQLERTKLLATLPESNPLFNPINQQISSTRAALRENLKSIKTSLNNTKRQLQSVGSAYNASIRNIPGQTRDLVDIKRNQGIKENLYTYLLQKKEEVSLDYASTISDAQVIDYAHNSSQKSPLSKAVYAIGLLIGLLIPTGILFGRDVIKNRILDKNDIISATGIPILSEIVFEQSDNPIVVLDQYNYIGEQFRDLRTKLNYLHGKHATGRITLFTSSIAGEGKSFVLSNLATVLSFAGKKTIILELDLRRPTLSGRFKSDKSKPGLTDFLIGSATKSQIVQSIPLNDNLFIIDSGSIPPNPSELLESDELITLLKDLRQEYDHILIDSPPIHLLTDAMIVAPLCDVSLYLIRQDFTPKQEIEYISDIYREKKLPKMNLIFNGVKSDVYGTGYSYQKNSYIKKSPTKFKNVVRNFFRRF